MPFGVVAGVSFVATYLAAQTGSGLQNLLDEDSAAIAQHEQWGDRTRIAAFVFFVLAVAFVVVVRRANRARTSNATARRPIAVPVLAVLLSMSAIATTAAVIRTGHTGATAVWEESDE